MIATPVPASAAPSTAPSGDASRPARPRARATLFAGLLAAALAGCGGGGGTPSSTATGTPAAGAPAAAAAADPTTATPAGSDPGPGTAPLVAPAAPQASATVAHKTVQLSWAAADPTATYTVQRQVAGGAWTDVASALPASSTGASVPIDAHLADWATTRYRVQACNAAGCGVSAEVGVAGRALQAIGYLKASNAEAGDSFGNAVALSADGLTMVVGAPNESSDGTNPTSNGLTYSGAAYVFVRSGSEWTQLAFLKASNALAGDAFGSSVAVSGDGTTIAVGAKGEASGAGAVYVFARNGAAWAQQAIVKAGNAEANDAFGSKVALSADGATLLAAAPNEAGGLPGTPTDNSAPGAGAAYVFVRTGVNWNQQAYLKAANVVAQAQGITQPAFGTSIALSADGNTAVIGSPGDSSKAVQVDGDPNDPNEINDTSTPGAGAAFVFRRSGASWSQAAYLKASNNDVQLGFGQSVAIDAAGTRIAVGAPGEMSNATGVGTSSTNQSLSAAGAAYVFGLTGVTWSQRAYVKATNTGANDRFGSAIALSGDGTTLAVLSFGESTQAFGLLGTANDETAPNSGAVYLYRNPGTGWTTGTVLKALNRGTGDAWTSPYTPALAVDADGRTVAVGFDGDDSGATGVGGSPASTTAGDSGAVTVW